jgi:hypothetical protein
MGVGFSPCFMLLGYPLPSEKTQLTLQAGFELEKENTARYMSIYRENIDTTY